MAGSRLSRSDRDVIERCRRSGMSCRDIGAVLGRHYLSVSREIKRNSNDRGVYCAGSAHVKAAVRARRPKERILDDKRVRAMVTTRVVGWRYSSGAAAADLRRVGIQISHETIYREIYRKTFGDPRQVLIRPRRSRRRRTRTGRDPHSLGQIPLIDTRPQRVGPGHWEVDLLSGTSNRTVVGVLTETHSKTTIVFGIAQRDADSVGDQLITMIQYRIPLHLRKTLTFDQGREFARWGRVGKTTYFCHPRSPWEKPLVEQTNSVLRRWLPKHKDMPTDQKAIDKINKLINNMPRRALNWRRSTDLYRELRVATTT